MKPKKSLKSKLKEEIKETKRLRRINKTEYGRGYLDALKVVLEWVEARAKTLRKEL